MKSNFTHVVQLSLTKIEKNSQGKKRSHEMLREFHISRHARDKYKFEDSIFSSAGNVIFANFHASRQFAQKMNEKRNLVNYPEQAVRAGQINALGLIDEILHYVIELYREQVDNEINRKALQWLLAQFGQEEIDETLLRFIQDFPPVAVYRREMSAEEYLKSTTKEVPNRLLVIEEMALLWLANKNPAFSPFLELFNDADLEKFSKYNQIIQEFSLFFENQPPFGPKQHNLIEMLREPAIAVPHSLSGQLQYMLDNWGFILGKYLYRLLGGLDLIKEEDKMRFAFGPGPTRVTDFKGLADEPERFSPDKDWMLSLILIAKSALVWLDQLSGKYGRRITRLDQIPDEELDRLARWGFTGLWLIGIWQRSSASKKIKQYCGNPEAESSAYSLFDYKVADELGGEAALFNLKERCRQRGIRLASDMVPNHTGIYSKWMLEHPDWFISQDYSPFPAYSFNGANLSEDPRVGIFIDDHYYEKTDAAVVCKRVDFETGEVKYIYHGNDGTNMPWNDTAQLNYLKPEVREAVIQTILHVARMFSIIRFDAAMTLTKKHYQRLWFPEPGTGGDIPSRAEHGMTKEQFDSLMPNEFWREVVDRVAQEIPDTLLLAEAFWLMEGYFVRTLGMHRVYNSAFMNMLKNEENEKYRNVIKKTVEFNPEILKRYVNFMNNPDEETAVAQFGKGDKYIGTCLMMVTMPGLPMFGHGQIEGFTEKYGMEYCRAYWDEQPDRELIAGHEKLIFPVMKKRYLFADVKNFLLYDFYAPEGHVNENVIAYSNRAGDERALVIYNNKFENAVGWLRTSAAYIEKTGAGLEQRLVQKTLGGGLSLRNDEFYFTIFRDHIGNLEYIRSSKEIHENGLFVELGAFQYHLFWEFREVADNEWRHYSQLNTFLAGRGVPSIDEALKELFLRPIHQKLAALMNVEQIRLLMTKQVVRADAKLDRELVAQSKEKYTSFLKEIKKVRSSDVNPDPLIGEFERNLSAILFISIWDERSLRENVNGLKESVELFHNQFSDSEFFWSVLWGWTLIHSIGKIGGVQDYEARSRSWIDEWLLGKILISTFKDLGLPESRRFQAVALIKILTSRQNWYDPEDAADGKAFRVLEKLFRDEEVQQFLQFNRYKGILWFNQEAYDSLLGWLFTVSLVDCISHCGSEEEYPEELKRRLSIIQKLLRCAQDSDFQVEKLMSIVKKSTEGE